MSMHSNELKSELKMIEMISSIFTEEEIINLKYYCIIKINCLSIIKYFNIYIYYIQYKFFIMNDI